MFEPMAKIYKDTLDHVADGIRAGHKLDKEMDEKGAERVLRGGVFNGPDFGGRMAAFSGGAATALAELKVLGVNVSGQGDDDGPPGVQERLGAKRMKKGGKAVASGRKKSELDLELKKKRQAKESEKLLGATRKTGRTLVENVLYFLLEATAVRSAPRP